MNGSFDPSVNLKSAEEERKSVGWKVDLKNSSFTYKIEILLEKI